MKNYLYNTEFTIYKGGLYEGIIRFKEDKIEIALVDARTREQLYFNEYRDPDARASLGYNRIHKNLSSYCNAKWKDDEIRLENGDLYSKHLTYSGEVEGKTIDSQLWAQRECGDVMDVITVGGEVIAFIHPGRTRMTIIGLGPGRNNINKCLSI